MRSDFYYPSKGAGRIHACKWAPEGEVKAVLQIVHGIAEYIERYEPFAEYLNSMGYLVVAEDHMGHGKSVGEDGIKGYFTGGWFTAVDDTYQLMRDTMAQYPGVPYVLFGHSMGSFMARTLLCRYPQSGIQAAVICGTGWQPKAILPVGITVCKLVCALSGERNPNNALQNMIFGGYNKKVTNPRTEYDWLTRDDEIVDAYIAHPMCGFVPSCGLLRDMLTGISYVQDEKNLAKMDKNCPVLFIAGADDPVGNYGTGVVTAANAFRKCGMSDVSDIVYPGGRHEILNETNKEEVFADVGRWLSDRVKI